MSQEQETFSIGVAAKLSNLSEHVIRIWEKRYKAIVPLRTPTNHRKYNQQLVQRLRLLNTATSLGLRIGSIATLSNETLIKQITELSPTSTRDKQHDQSEHLVTRCFELIEDMNQTQLYNVLQQSCYDLSQQAVLTTVITPLAMRVGDSWHQGLLSVAQEHLATVVLKKFLLNMIDSQVLPGRKTIAIGTLEGCYHVVGALMAAVTASQSDWNTIYFGANMPAQEITRLALSQNVNAIGLSLLYVADEEKTKEQLRFLRKALPTNVSIYLGGQDTKKLLDATKNMQMIITKNLDDFANELSTISHQPPQ